MRVRQQYADGGLTLLAPLGFDNTFAILVRGEDARAAKLRDDLRRCAGRAALAGRLRLRVPAARRWLSRAGRGLRAAVREPPRGDGSVAHLPGAGRAPGRPHRRRRDERADRRLDLTMLEDDRHYFPPYDAVPVVRARPCCAHPAVRAGDCTLSGRISVAECAEMNRAVDSTAATRRMWSAISVSDR